MIQQVLPASGVSYIFAFSQGASDTTIVSLRDIQGDRIYEVRSAERGTIGRVRGADLIAQGFEIARAPESRRRCWFSSRSARMASAPPPAYRSARRRRVGRAPARRAATPAKRRK